MKIPKLIVVGIDGGGFELIQRWLDKKELPNLRYMIGHGISGDLLSCLPPVTSPNWRCFSTGKNPGKLGLFWWRNLDVQNHRIISLSANNKRIINFWNLISNNGYRTCVINTPLTYPPQSINGYIISGGPDALDKGFCYPASFEEKLCSQFGYRVHSKTSHDFTHQSSNIQEILELIENRFKVAEFLIEKDEIDFMQVTSFYINVLQHFLWNEMPVKKGWEIIDKWIGRFLDKGTNVWIMSDHGSMPVDVEFSINCWLEEKGFLVLKKAAGDQLRVWGITRERLNFLIDTLRLRHFIKKNIPSVWRDFIPDKEGGLRGEGGLNKVEWDQSVALGLGQGPLYITSNKKNETYQRLLREITVELKKLKLPESERKIAKDVKRADSIYHGPAMAFSPDLVIDYNHGFHVSGKFGKKVVFSKPYPWKAANKKEGIFIAFGPDMKRGLNIHSLSILDLAPTILHLFGIAISENMDGKTRKELFANDSRAAHRDVKIIPEGDLKLDQDEEGFRDEKIIARRLRDLGYLD